EDLRARSSTGNAGRSQTARAGRRPAENEVIAGLDRSNEGSCSSLKGVAARGWSSRGEDARELRCPLNAGCPDARLPYRGHSQAAGERWGEGEPELDRRSAPSHPLAILPPHTHVTSLRAWRSPPIPPLFGQSGAPPRIPAPAVAHPPPPPP